MTKLEKEIAKLRKSLEELQRQKAKSRPPKKVKSDRPRGRPPVDENKIAKARELAGRMTLPGVALKLEIGLSTLYRYNIKRKILKAEIEAMPEFDLLAELSPGQITD